MRRLVQEFRMEESEPDSGALDQLNLHGEFLGVTSMACYSAPWHLQGVLLCLIGYLFFHRIRAGSLENREVIRHLETKSGAVAKQKQAPPVDQLEDLGAALHLDEEDEDVHVLENFNRIFFGFTVAKKDQAAYWAGFSIYLITSAHVLVITLRALPGEWHRVFG